MLVLELQWSYIKYMEDVIKILNDTFHKSAIEPLKDYIRTNSEHDKWLLYSDYCIGDKNKPNDVISFTLILI